MRHCKKVSNFIKFLAVFVDIFLNALANVNKKILKNVFNWFRSY